MLKQVAYLSQLLFTQTRGILHNYPEDIGHLLWSAAMLHDVGMFIGRNGHHKHSYYLIKNAGLLGHSEEEVALIASIARYHRGSEPKVTHEAWYSHDLEGRKIVYDLASFLRIAEALDRSHKQVVKNLRVIVSASSKDGQSGNLSLFLNLHENSHCQSEIWALNEKRSFFENHFQAKLEVLVDAGVALAQSE